MLPVEKRRTVLVTGATGFVARHLMPALIHDQGADTVTVMINPQRSPREEAFRQTLVNQGIRIIECDLMTLPRHAPPPPQFDVLYHLAAFADTEKATAGFEVNSRGTKLLVEWLAPVLGGKQVVFTGTLASVDRDYPKNPLNESTSCHPKTPYGRTKLIAEEYLRESATELKYKLCILRLCTIVGQGYRSDGMFGLFPDLLARNALATRLNWPGHASFLGVADLVRILLAVPSHPEMANETYVLSNGENPTFDQFIGDIAKLHGFKRQRLILPQWCWEVIARIGWRLVEIPALPHSARIAAWRMCHLIHDGLCADASKLNAVLDMQYQSLGEVLRHAYEKPQ